MKNRDAELRAGGLVMLGLAVATAITTWSSAHDLETAHTDDDVARLHPLVWAVNGLVGREGVVGCGVLFVLLFFGMGIAALVIARRSRG